MVASRRELEALNRIVCCVGRELKRLFILLWRCAKFYSGLIELGPNLGVIWRND